MARKLTDRLALLEGAPEQSRVNIICRRIIGDDGIPDGTEYRTTIIPGQPPKRDVLNSAGLGVIDNG